MSATQSRSGAVAWNRRRTIRCGRRGRGLAARLATPPTVGTLDTGQPHQSRYRLAVPAVTALVQLSGKPAGAIDASMIRPGLTGDRDALFVVALPVEGTLPACLEPLIEGAVADAEQAAEQTDRVGGLLRVDEPVDVGPVHRFVSRAKKTDLDSTINATLLVDGWIVARMGRPGMSDAMKEDLWRRWRAGESISVISRALGKPPGSVFRY